MTRLKILAIDDSRTMRDLVRAALEAAGFEVATAEDGLIGIASMNEVNPDVIITDINMPNLDGFGVIDAVRKMPRRGNVPILVLTTESSQAMRARARERGATGWIVKPFDDDRLVTAIRKVARA